MKTPFLSVAVSALLLILSASASARTIEGINFPEATTADYYYPSLQLNGAAKRTYYYVVDMYIGLLYMQHPSRDASEVISNAGYKRMVFHTLLSRASGRRIGKALYESLKLTPEEAEKLGAPIEEVISMFDVEMTEGDQTFIEYVPNEGTRIIVKGELRGEIPGKKLFDAFLGIWIGDTPFSEEFKNGILGKSDTSNKENQNLADSD